MSYWMEIRCEFRGHATKTFWENGDEQRCLSFDNEGPMGPAYESIEGIKAAYKSLEADAKRSGWKKLRTPIVVEGDDIEGWICPHCIKHEDVFKDQNVHKTSG